MTTSINNNNFTIDSKKRNSITELNNCENDDCRQMHRSTSRRIMPITETSLSNINADNVARIECIHTTVGYSSDNQDEENDEDEREETNYDDKDTQSDDSIELDNNRQDNVRKEKPSSGELHLKHDEKKNLKCLNNRSQTNFSHMKNSDSVSDFLFLVV
jgi:hypothetical protein